MSHMAYIKHYTLNIFPNSEMFWELMQLLTMGPFFVSDFPSIEIEEIVKTTYLNI